MSTPAQVAANQANAQHSTGPRTTEGKAATRSNATSHGLCTSIALLPHEDRAKFTLLLADLHEEHQPATPTEEILVYKMAENFFAGVRAQLHLTFHLNINGEEKDSRQFALMLRYQTAADRAFNRNLHDLRKLQKERREQEREQEAIGSVPQNVEPVRPEPVPATPAIPFEAPSTRHYPTPAAFNLPNPHAA